MQADHLVGRTEEPVQKVQGMRGVVVKAAAAALRLVGAPGGALGAGSRAAVFSTSPGRILHPFARYKHHKAAIWHIARESAQDDENPTRLRRFHHCAVFRHRGPAPGKMQGQAYPRALRSSLLRAARRPFTAAKTLSKTA
jgi:hypothetical protein